MTRIINLTADEAKTHFLKGSSYFRGDFPNYISFQPILDSVAELMGNKQYSDYQGSAKPTNLADVNYRFTANKDGRFGWRPHELIHPAIYVSLVNLICSQANWKMMTSRFRDLEGGLVECCSAPLMSTTKESDTAAQIRNWWLDYEQKSVALSLEFTHLLQTDVADCYGSIYTHSIAWALHGYEEGKKKKGNKTLLGNCPSSYKVGHQNGLSIGGSGSFV